MTRIVSAEKSAEWMAVLTWVLDRPDARATECDEPEQQNASDQLAIDMMHPSVLRCRSDAGHVTVSNPNYLPHCPPQPKALQSEKTDRDGGHARSDQSNESFVS
jgi:hypothetical protein